MRQIYNLHLFKIFPILFVSLIAYYLFEFYLIENNANLHFWCININNNFNLGSLKAVSLPIHCDEGPYRLASQSIEQFFSKNNPYQSRPLYVFLIYFISNLIDSLLFFDLSEYQNFRLSMIILQTVIMTAIISLFVSLLKLEFNSYRDFFIIILLIGIPGVRWNLFFPSAGNITLLLFLIILKLVVENKTLVKNKKSIYLFLSFLSLAHLTSIIYGFIYELINILRFKKTYFLSRIFNIGLLLIFPVLYRLMVYFLGYDFYDWHTGVYGQFSWIIYEIQDRTFFNFQTLGKHLATYLKITLNYLGYFLILLAYFFTLVILVKNKQKVIPITVKYAFLINSIIFIFWGLQGIYESFRFTNYSIGYFLFISIFIFLVESFNKNLYLISALFFYTLSIGYAEPYNEALNYPNLNYFTYLSVGFFIVFIFKEIRLKKEKIKL